MISRTYLTRGGNLTLLDADVPDATLALERDGYAIVRGGFSPDEVAELGRELHELFDNTRPDVRLPGATEADYADFRYEALNRSAAAQAAVAHRSRPHIPRSPDVPWDDRIAYPVFMVGCHILLQDCGLESGPTGFVPRSHTSGRLPPDPDSNGMITYDGAEPDAPLGCAGDVVFFVSDVWHRRMPTGPMDEGRFFLQVQYGRRDIAQRIRPTTVVNHLSDQAVARARTDRQKTVVGRHPLGIGSFRPCAGRTSASLPARRTPRRC